MRLKYDFLTIIFIHIIKISRVLSLFKISRAQNKRKSSNEVPYESAVKQNKKHHAINQLNEEEVALLRHQKCKQVLSLVNNWLNKKIEQRLDGIVASAEVENGELSSLSVTCPKCQKIVKLSIRSRNASINNFTRHLMTHVNKNGKLLLPNQTTLHNYINTPGSSLQNVSKN